MTPEADIVVISVVTAVACSLPGAFLVLRRMALVSDAIAHAVLPGIVVAFFLTGSLSSPLLLVAAAVTGVLTVVLIEGLSRTRLVTEDAAIGLVFPALFSVGVILISRHVGNVHLDTDSVLLGELALAPFDRLLVAGVDLGPAALWSMGTILLVDLVFVVAFFKELKIATVDAGQAAVLGLAPVALHYALMAVVSVTAVGAFNSAGSILVVALMIAPPATAYLLVDRFAPMLWVSAAVAAVGAVLGCWLAFALDVSIAGCLAIAAGALFAAAFLVAPERGLVAQVRRRAARRLELAVRMLLVHLLHHEGTPAEVEECAEPGLYHHLQWPEGHTRTVVRAAAGRSLVATRNGVVRLTEVGRDLARRAVVGRLD